MSVEQIEQEAAGQNNTRRVYCRNCGSPANFDIIEQTYCCSHCQESSGFDEDFAQKRNWRFLSSDYEQQQQGIEQHFCPSCSAIVIFCANEGSQTCDFCASKLVRSQLTSANQLPDLIIPFFINTTEAKEYLLAWAKKNKSKEAKEIIKNIDK